MSSAVQVIRFPRKDWSLQDANNWVFSHGFAPIKISKEAGRWNFRLEDPSQFDHFATKIVHSHTYGERPVYLVFGFRQPRRSF